MGDAAARTWACFEQVTSRIPGFLLSATAAVTLVCNTGSVLRTRGGGGVLSRMSEAQTIRERNKLLCKKAAAGDEAAVRQLVKEGADPGYKVGPGCPDRRPRQERPRRQRTRLQGGGDEQGGRARGIREASSALLGAAELCWSAVPTRLGAGAQAGGLFLQQPRGGGVRSEKPAARAEALSCMQSRGDSNSARIASASTLGGTRLCFNSRRDMGGAGAMDSGGGTSHARAALLGRPCWGGLAGAALLGRPCWGGLAGAALLGRDPARHLCRRAVCPHPSGEGAALPCDAARRRTAAAALSDDSDQAPQ